MKLRTALAALALAAAALPASAQTLPDEIAASKTIRIAVNSGYVPMEMRDPQGNLTGFDVDLANAIAKILGVKLEWQDGSFEQLMPALRSQRADMIISGISDLPARRSDFDFIDYIKSGAVFFVATSAADIKTLADLCGKAISTPRGTSYVGIIGRWSDANCVKDGKPPITVLAPTDAASMLSDIRQGRAAGGMQGTESVPSVMKREPGVYRVLGDPVTNALQGIVFLKSDTQLRDAVMAALQKVIADGEYDTLIKKWDLTLSAYPTPTINAGPAP